MGLADVQVYPNPTSGAVHLKFDEKKNNVSIEIKSIDGKRIIQVSEKNVSNLNIDFEGLSGVFFINIIADNAVYDTVRIIKL